MVHAGIYGKDSLHFFPVIFWNNLTFCHTDRHSGFQTKLDLLLSQCLLLLLHSLPFKWKKQDKPCVSCFRWCYSIKLRYNPIEQRCRKRPQSASASSVSCFVLFCYLRSFGKMWQKPVQWKQALVLSSFYFRTVFQPRLLLWIKVLTWPHIELIKTVFLFHQNF